MNNSLKAIESEIIRDANEEASRQRELAERRAGERTEARKKELERDLRHRRERNSREAADHKERLLSAADLEEKKMRLRAKQDSIDAAFSAAIEAFGKMDRGEYAAWIESLMLAYAESGEEEVLVGTADADLIDLSFLGRVNTELEKAGKAGALTLAGEAASFARGFVLRAAHAEINCNVEALVRTERKRLESQVAGILFG